MERKPRFSADPERLAAMKPVYVTLPGWKSSTTQKSYGDLPDHAKRYLSFIMDSLEDVELKIVSVGQKRDQTIIL